ncbi:MAG: hypothetical protein DRJ47_07125 [Thermoprotei archaeon]|nr:MAG: hypothetical protein DRJ47_07125 [Thermoprotei archaeon]
MGYKEFKFKGYISIREALKDYLRDQGLTIEDILDAMDEDPKSLLESLLKRVNLSYKEALKIEEQYTPSQLNLLIFAIQLFYITMKTNYYKGFIIIPLREEVVGADGKVTRDGLRKIIRSLGLRPRWSTFRL